MTIITVLIRSLMVAGTATLTALTVAIIAIAIASGWDAVPDALLRWTLGLLVGTGIVVAIGVTVFDYMDERQAAR